MTHLYKYINTIINDDVLKGLKKLPDNSINCIITSPPCPSHSRIRKHCAMNRKDFAKPEMLYPDMKLYEEILFLQHYFI